MDRERAQEFLTLCLKFILNRAGYGVVSELVDLGAAAVPLVSDLWDVRGLSEVIRNSWEEHIGDRQRAEAQLSRPVPIGEVRDQAVELTRARAADLSEPSREHIARALIRAAEGLNDWALVCERLRLDAGSRRSVRGMLRATMDELGVTDLSDPALAVNWREVKQMAVSYGRIKAFDIQRRADPPGFELWLPVKEERFDVFQPVRQPRIMHFTDRFKDGDWIRAGLIQVSLVAGRPPQLTGAERQAWYEGLRAARDRGMGKRSGYRNYKTARSLIGPWLLDPPSEQDSTVGWRVRRAVREAGALPAR